MPFEYRNSRYTMEEAVGRGMRKLVVDGDISKNNFFWYDRAATMLCAYTASEYIFMRRLSTEEIVRIRGSEYTVRSLPQSAELLPYAQEIQAYLQGSYPMRGVDSLNVSRIAKELGRVAPIDDNRLAIITGELASPSDPAFQ